MPKPKKFKAMLMDGLNEIKEHSLDAFKMHIESIPTVEAWLLKSRQQCKDELTGEYFQVIDPLDYRPVQIFSDIPAEDDSDIEVISSQKEDEEMTLLDTEERKDGRLLWIGIALAGTILTLLIAILLSFKNRTPEVINATNSAISIINSLI